MVRATLPPGVVITPPIWALSAEHSAEHVRRAQHDREARAIVAALVTTHPAYYDADPVTASALTLERLAKAQGMTTRMHVGLDGCTLEGRVDGVRRGFVASWSRGKAQAVVWFEPEARYGMIHDTRPIGVSKRDHTALAGKRAAGVDTEHLAQIAGPNGVTISFAELTARVKGLANG